MWCPFGRPYHPWLPRLIHLALNRIAVIVQTTFKHIHDDVIKWKHFPRCRLFVRGIHRPPVNSSHKGQWRGALMFSLICAWSNGWVNNRDAGDLRRHGTHYDVTVMFSWKINAEFYRYAEWYGWDHYIWPCQFKAWRCDYLHIKERNEISHPRTNNQISHKIMIEITYWCPNLGWFW